MLQELKAALTRPTDIASIAIFRMAFGAIMLWEVIRFFDREWVRKFYISRDFYFKYYGFEWVHPWPGDGMYIFFVIVGIAATCLALGLLYRLASLTLFLGITYWFLLDQTRYLNHFYLLAILSFFFVLIPAHRARSLDSKFKPSLHSDTLPAWCLLLLRFQIAVVYIYGGIAKLTPDWFRGEPMRSWLKNRSDYPLIGPLLETEAAVAFFTYGGLLFDLFIIPALIWKPSRKLAFAACLFFHTVNAWFFNIGIFPAAMVAASTLFFAPDWPRKALLLFSTRKESSPATQPPTPINAALLAFLLLFAAAQLLIPFRHLLYPGNVHWTEEGHRFSWHMKLRSKSAKVLFTAYDPQTNQRWEIDHTDTLSVAQSDRVGRFPDMVLQYAHHLAQKFRQDGYPDIQIYARSLASLNGREPQLLIDPSVDLAQIKRSLDHSPWILPLSQPLPKR